jgi:hypothetical protein
VDRGSDICLKMPVLMAYWLTVGRSGAERPLAQGSGRMA